MMNKQNKLLYIPGMDKIMKNKIKHRQFEMKDLATDEEHACLICMKVFTQHQEVGETGCPSKHIFHSDCLDTYLDKYTEDPVCPICQEPITDEYEGEAVEEEDIELKGN